MTEPIVETLIVDLLEWLADCDRSYEEVMDAWRTSCPRLPVWEEANERGFIMREHVNGRALIKPSLLGLSVLNQRKAIKA